MMTTKSTILLHSRTGLAALTAGIAVSADAPSKHLPRLLQQVRKPGQFLAFETEGRKVICFNSGAAGQLVDQIIITATSLWGGTHIKAVAVPEGRLAGLRSRLYCSAPEHIWLLSPELKQAQAVDKWM